MAHCCLMHHVMWADFNRFNCVKLKKAKIQHGTYFVNP